MDERGPGWVCKFVFVGKRMCRCVGFQVCG